MFINNMPIDYNSINDPKYAPKFLSEYTMGQLDFLRYNDHLKFVERICGEINSTDVPTLEQSQEYFSGLNTLYKLWRPLLSIPQVVNEMDGWLTEAKSIKRRWEKTQRYGGDMNDVLKLKMVDLLDQFHTRLMYLKQMIGLGIAVKKNFTTKQKIRMGMGVSKIDKLVLPEP